MESILTTFGVVANAGVEVSKSPMRIDLLTERSDEVSEQLGVLARLLNSLPKIVVFEFKGPTDPLREEHLWQTIAHAALVVRERKLSFSYEIGTVIVSVGRSERLCQQISLMTVEVTHGWHRCDVLLSEANAGKTGGLHMHIIDLRRLSLEANSLPFPSVQGRL